MTCYRVNIDSPNLHSCHINTIIHRCNSLQCSKFIRPVVLKSRKRMLEIHQKLFKTNIIITTDIIYYANATITHFFGGLLSTSLKLRK